MTDWITHEGTEPPLLAPAALVEHEVWYDKDRPWFGGIVVSRVDAFDGGLWHPGFVYRPLIDDEGHKLISAEGLKPWARWVATDKYGVEVWQYDRKPIPMWDHWDEDDDLIHEEDINSTLAPETHRHPGNWRESLYRVEGR